LYEVAGKILDVTKVPTTLVYEFGSLEINTYTVLGRPVPIAVTGLHCILTLTVSVWVKAAMLDYWWMTTLTMTVSSLNYDWSTLNYPVFTCSYK
jgi:hypothetical protein